MSWNDIGSLLFIGSMAFAAVAMVVWAVLFVAYWGTTLWEKLFSSRSSAEDLFDDLNQDHVPKSGTEDPAAMAQTFDFDSFVDHPRYGKHPRITTQKVYRPWHSPRGECLTNTAVRADESRQQATIPVSYYFDAIRRCVDCRRQFIFFAEEQKYWYEELGFNLNADCIRCVPCRRGKRSVERLRRQYERLFHVQYRSIGQDLEMADICLTLVERGAFHRRQTEHVRMLLNRVAARGEAAYDSRRQELLERVVRVEVEAGVRGPEPPPEKV